jgi:hypothetical protein
MKCPKCGYEQAEALVCISCGIAVNKYLQRLEQIRDAHGTVKKMFSAAAPALAEKGLYFAPNIPRDVLIDTWSRFACAGLVDPDEELLALLHDDSDAYADTPSVLFTGKGILACGVGLMKACDYTALYGFDFTGIAGTTLRINDSQCHLGFIAVVQKQKKEAFKKLLKNVAGLARAAQESGTWRSRAPVASGSGDVPQGLLLRQSGTEPLDVANLPEQDPADTPQQASANPASTPVISGPAPRANSAAAAARPAARPPEKIAQAPAPAVRKPDQPAPAAAGDVASAPPAPEPSGGSPLIARAAGFIGGAVVFGITLLIFNALGSTGSWTQWVSLIIGVGAWNAIADGIKAKK